MKKVILMGKKGSGKSTLRKKVENLDINFVITKSIELEDEFEHSYEGNLNNEYSHNILNKLESDIEIIALLYDPTQSECLITPGLANKFSAEVIGIITKIKKCESSINIQIGRERLEIAGVSRIFEIDTKEEIGLDELFNYIC